MGTAHVNPLEGEVGGYWLCRDKIPLFPPCDSVILLLFSPPPPSLAVTGNWQSIFYSSALQSVGDD